MSNNQYPPSGQQLYQYNQYQQASQTGFPPGNANNYQPPPPSGFPPGSANYYSPPPGFPPGNANAYQPPGQAGFSPGNFPPGSVDAYQQPPPPNYAAATQGGSEGYPQDRKWLYETQQPQQEQQGGQLPYAGDRGIPAQATSYPGQQQWGGQGQSNEYQQYQQQQAYQQQYPPQTNGAASEYYGTPQQAFKGGDAQQCQQYPQQQQYGTEYPQQQQYGTGYPQQGQHGQPGAEGADRGLGSTLVGGAAGAFVGKKLGMGKFMGAAGGAMVANLMSKKRHH